MKRKKLLSTAVAGTLVAAQMVMPVMAADGGEVDVNVTTKTAVIRVEVPTTLAIAVDQFMMSGDNTQISSGAFEMTNKSAVDVKVTVTSTAKLAATTKLVATKAGAADSTKEGEAWLGVAAKSSATSYDDPTTDTSDNSDSENPVADTPETISTLTEANKNVATFVQGTGEDAAKGTATQVFYLAKGTGDVGYKMLNAGEDASAINYAQFYLLTKDTTATGVGADELAALIKDNDVYVATAAADNGQSLELVAKGGTHTYSATEIYYTAAATPTAKASLESDKLYVYGATANAATGGAAAFRYLGTLSGKQESWTNTDIEKITIKYDIVGVTAEKYSDVATDVKYGLYIAATPAEAAPSITGTTVTFSKANGAEITVDLGAGDLAATGIASVATVGGDGKDYTWAAADYSFAGSKLTMNKTAQYLAGVSTGSTRKVKITFNDTAKTMVELTATVAE